jgi:hypothetical protein
VRAPRWRIAILAGVGFAPFAFPAESARVLPASAHNFTVRLTITSLRSTTNYGEETAPAGRRFLVFGATWEDVIDPAFAASRELPAGCKDDDLSVSLSLVIDGDIIVPVAAHEANAANLDADDPDIVGRSGGSTDTTYLRKVVGLKNAAGKRSLVYYDLEKPGAKTTGELVFAAPLAPWHTLELRYHDSTGGDCSLWLAGERSSERAGSGAVAGDPPGTQSNEVFALAAHVTEDPAKNASPPPPRRRFVAVELRGRSLLKVEDEFQPYDPSHQKGETWWRPDPANWIEFRDNLQLVADGTLPCRPENLDEVPETATFAAIGSTRQRLLYLVPVSAKSLDLVCFFPSYTIPGRDADVTPTPMRFHLAGPNAAASEASRSAERKIVDGPLEFFVTRHQVAPAFAGEVAAEGERFLIVDFALRNTGAECEEFTCAEQLVWFDHDSERAPDEITARGPLAPPPFFHLPPHELRAFQVVWRIPAKLAKAEMGLKGNAAAEKFSLPLASD